MDYVYWSSAEYPFDFLHAAIVKLYGSDGASHDHSDDEIKDTEVEHGKLDLTVYRPTAREKVEAMGYRVGYSLVMRISKDFPRLTTDLECMKFICKEMWAAVFGKQVDNLRTNHHDMFVILDNQFRLLTPMSTSEQYTDVAPKYLTFTCGLLRGALANLGAKCTVVGEVTNMPGAKFSITIQRVEKYRPCKLADLISHEEIIATIQKLVDEGTLPHLLLYGPPGTGKTTTILACARRLYSPAEFKSMVLEVNASDDRGIGVIRDQVVSFASTKNVFGKTFKLIILDETDAMTRQAQNSLRRVIEKYSENVRFCLVCNYLSKIIPAIQSRCTRFRFAPLAPEQMRPRIKHVISAEGITVTEEGLEALLELSSGDMRRVLNVMQATSYANEGPIDAKAVYSCVAHPLPQDIESAVDWMLNRELADAFQYVLQLKTEKGLALLDMVTEIHKYINRLSLTRAARILLLQKLGEIEFRISIGADEKLQLAALLSAFFQARDVIVAEIEGQPAS